MGFDSRGILSPLRLPIPPPGLWGVSWRLGSGSNRRTRFCKPLHDHSATQPKPRVCSTELVGWAERSEAQQFYPTMLGLAPPRAHPHFVLPRPPFI